MDGCIPSPSAIDRFWARVDKGGPCWLWRGTQSPPGRGQVRFEGRHRATSHVAWLLATGEPVPPGLWVLHTCDDGLCVRNDDAGVYVLDGDPLPRRGHLFLGNHDQNMLDKNIKGRVARGERHGSVTKPEAVVRGSRHGMARLTEADIPIIRALHTDGLFYWELAEEFGVSINTIQNVVTRKTWEHIP